MEGLAADYFVLRGFLDYTMANDLQLGLHVLGRVAGAHLHNDEGSGG